MTDDGWVRRDFLKGMATSLVVLLTDEQLLAAGLSQEPALPQPPVRFGVVGLGEWGREILAQLSRLASAQVVAVCDTYEPFLKKGLDLAPKASGHTDFRRLLDSRDVEAIVIATPTHLHKELALASFQAQKHVYCEAPIAASVDDARAIALAAQRETKLTFQAGLQGRSNAIYKHVLQFVKAGVLGGQVQISGQWNRKQSWRRVAPTPEREQELNWRLSNKLSSGLIGEVGIHQLDLIDWYLGALPIAATGFGSISNWNDGREAPDTVQCILEYPAHVRAIYSSTLANSFSDAYTLFQGANCSLMMRENRAWMVKEADSPLLGWEVYARKEQIHNETGICMVADATKLIEAGKEPGKEATREPETGALYGALANFTRSIRENVKVVCGPIEGFQATAVSIKANEAVIANRRIAFEADLLDVK
jgi:predicted dehydrogenase